MDQILLTPFGFQGCEVGIVNQNMFYRVCLVAACRGMFSRFITLKWREFIMEHRFEFIVFGSLAVIFFIISRVFGH